MAQSNFSLNSEEYVIMKHDRVGLSGTFSHFSNEVILTNHNIIIKRKGLYGGLKETKKIPIHQIKVYNESAQIFITSQSYGFHQIEIYLTGGHQKLIFTTKKDAEKWALKINLLVVDGNVDVDKSPGTPFTGTEAISNFIQGTKDMISGGLALKSKGEFAGKTNTNQKVVFKCVYCGAPVTGFENKVVRCLYCNSEHKI